MKVNEATAQALRKSIAHWERMTTGDRHDGEGLGAFFCALCNIFNQSHKPFRTQCLGCPVHNDTKQQHCGLTPYQAAVNASNGPKEYEEPAFYRAATAELRYLCELAGRLGVDLD